MSAPDTDPTVIDVAALLDRCLQNAALAQRLATRFLGDAAPHLERVRSALATGDGAAAAQELHKLRGSLGVFGAAAAHAAAQQVEDRAAAGDVPGANALLSGLTEAVDLACRALEHFRSYQMGSTPG